MSEMKNLFGRISSAKSYQRGTRLEAGEYPSLTLVKLSIKEGQKGKKDSEYGLAEFIVNESVATAENPNPAPKGSKREVPFNFKDEWGYGLGRLKSFVMALLGISAVVPKALVTGDAVSEEDFDATLEDLMGKEKRTDGKPSGHESQPMRGKSIAGSGGFAWKDGVQQKTKKGEPIVNYSWSFIAQDGDGVAAERKKLDAAGQ